MSDAPTADRSAFRDAMARWATGVSVVTAHADGADAGLTVNAFLSVALEPPSVLVALTQDVDTLPVLERSGAFAVSVLAAGQRAVSERFARAIPTAEKFQGIGVHRGTTGAPLLDGALAALECRVARIVPVYDHRLVIGEVERIERGPDGAPLLFYRSGYATEGPDGAVRLPPPRAR